MPSPELRTHRLHLVSVHSEVWQQRLMFRDALRARPALAAEYARLKVELAEQHRFDREVYTQAKSAFIRGVLREVARGDILQRAKVTDEADLEGTEPGAVRGLRAPPNTHRADIPRLRAAVFGELEIRYVYNASAQRSAEV
jgi:hypothetical protein